MGSVLNFIKSSPSPFKNLFFNIIPFSYRYSKKYREYTAFLHIANKTWTYDQAKDYQLSKLRELLVYSYNNVPYYNKLFNDFGLNPAIKNFDDIKILPFLTKYIIRNNFENLKAGNFTGKTYKQGTSGTTGKRLEFYCTDDTFKIEAATINFAYKQHGTELYSKPSLWLRRYSPKENEPWIYYDVELKRYYMSIFHLTEENIAQYIKFIDDTKADTLVSYPSTIYYLALLCEKFSLKLKYVKFLHGASEVCLPQWREKIRSILGVSIKMHYGQIERVSFGYQDSEDDYYHENLLYSFNEVIEDTIVGTGFNNAYMPFIRYKTEDKVTIFDNPQLISPFPKTIKEILGRNGDVLYTKEGSTVSSVNFYSFMGKQEDVDMFQIVQKKDTLDVTLYVVPSRLFKSHSSSNLTQEIKNRLGDINVHVSVVNEIKRDNNSSKLKTIMVI